MTAEAPLPRARRFLAAQAGVAAVEFALIAPILLLVWLGGVELTQALSVDRRLTALAGSVGDLAARSKLLTEAEVDNILDLTGRALYPHDPAPASVVLTAVDIDPAGKAKVAWSRSRGERGAHAAEADLTDVMDPKLLVPGTQLILSEVFYAYHPILGYVITGPVSMEKRLNFVPRQAGRVALCKNADETDCV